MAIHPTAIVHPEAAVAPDSEIGPYCIVGEGVRIGSRTRLLAHVYLDGRLSIGDDNTFYPYCSCGAVPQDKKFQGEDSETRIGHRNSIREFVTINRGTSGGGMVTAIGNDNLLMAYVHVAHDVLIGNNCVLANGVTFAGHVVVEDFANVGGLSAIHQFVRIGRHAMVGSYSVIKQDVLPFSITASEHEARVFSANRVGLERSGFSPDSIESLNTALRTLTRAGLNTSQALARIEEELAPNESVGELLSFIRSSQRGFLK